MPGIGFSQKEILRGGFRFLDAPEKERSVRLDVEFMITDWKAWLNSGQAPVRGTMSCEGFSADAPVTGSLLVDPIRRRMLAYDLSFTVPDRSPLRFYGEKRLDLLRPATTVTTLHARIEEEGLVIATGTLKLDLKDIWELVKSFRPVVG